jgi:hypothetical protein|tara:strand:+ start:19168 stop:20088 length:921 start_codon:yes stop_codon:yes gene_type:complete
MSVSNMGLLDKASDSGTKAAAPKAAKAVPKAVALAKPVKAAKAVKAVKSPKAAKVAKATKVRKPILSTAGLPEGYEIATQNSRFLAWLMNFIWNFGVLFGALFLSVMGSTPTIPAVIALIMLITNLIVIPIMTGRTLGNFMSRTRYVTSAEAKPNFIHGLLVNSVGLMALVGVSLIIFNMGQITNDTGKVQGLNVAILVLGIILVGVRMVDGRFKKNSDQNQGLYDMLFGAYLVKYVPQEGEELTGIAARLERMANYGDSFTQAREASRLKKVEKEAMKAEENQAGEKESEDKENTGDDSKKESKK